MQAVIAIDGKSYLTAHLKEITNNNDFNWILRTLFSSHSKFELDLNMNLKMGNESSNELSIINFKSTINT